MQDTKTVLDVMGAIELLKDFRCYANGSTFAKVWGENMGAHFACDYFGEGRNQYDVMALWMRLDGRNRKRLCEYMVARDAREKEVYGEY